MIELYAVSAHPAPPLPVLDDAALRFTAAGELAVVWGPAATVARRPTLAALRRHAGIVEALMSDRDVLPMRFGTRVADARAAERALDERRADLARGLQQVRGAAEVGVRVAPAPGATRADGAMALDVVHRPLAERARASRLRKPAGEELLRAAYLVDRGEIDAFLIAAGALQESRRDLRVVCTGPWPAYSFTTPGA